MSTTRSTTTNNNDDVDMPNLDMPKFVHQGIEYECVKAPSREDKIDQIKNPGCFGTVETKRSLVRDIVNKKEDVLLYFRDRNPTVASVVEKALPQLNALNNKNKYKAVEVAACIHDLAEAWLSFSMESTIRVTRNTRDQVADLFAPLIQAYHDGNRLALEKLQNDTKAMMVRTDGKRNYMQDAIKPPDEALRHCVICGHDKVDYPNINMEREKRNLDKEKKYVELKEAHEAAVKRGETNKSRAPNRPKMEKLYVECHCGQIRGIVGGAIMGTNNCDCEDGNCEVCKCPCRAAYDITAYQNLFIKRCMDKGMPEFEESEAKKREASALFFSQTIHNAAQISMNAALAHAMATNTPVDMKAANEGMYLNAAMEIAKTMTHDSAHQPWIRQQQDFIGKPSTKVSLPGGIIYDTRDLTANNKKSHRARNNNLDNNVISLISDHEDQTASAGVPASSAGVPTSSAVVSTSAASVQTSAAGVPAATAGVPTSAAGVPNSAVPPASSTTSTTGAQSATGTNFSGGANPSTATVMTSTPAASVASKSASAKSASTASATINLLQAPEPADATDIFLRYGFDPKNWENKKRSKLYPTLNDGSTSKKPNIPPTVGGPPPFFSMVGMSPDCPDYHKKPPPFSSPLAVASNTSQLTQPFSPPVAPTSTTSSSVFKDISAYQEFDTDNMTPGQVAFLMEEQSRNHESPNSKSWRYADDMFHRTKRRALKESQSISVGLSPKSKQKAEEKREENRQVYLKLQGLGENPISKDVAIDFIQDLSHVTNKQLDDAPGMSQEVLTAFAETFQSKP